jgi:hypothetical protein
MNVYVNVLLGVEEMNIYVNVLLGGRWNERLRKIL